MNCVASGQDDDRVRLPTGEERRAASQYLRAANDSDDRRERESLLRRAAELILPRKRPRGRAVTPRQRR